MKTKRTIIAWAIAAAAAAASGLSLAHPGGWGYGHGMGQGMGPGMGYGMGPGMGYGMGRGMGPGMGPGMGWGMGGGFAGSETAVAERLASLKSELKITAAQEAAWTALEKQAKEQFTSTQAIHRQMQEQMHGPQAAEKSAADFAALRESMFALQKSNAEARTAALKDLYAVLTTEQKTAADRLFGGPGFARGPGRGFGGCAFASN